MNEKNRAMVFAVTVLSIAAAFSYVVVRAILIFFPQYSLAERSLAVLLISAESFIMLHLIGYAMTIIKTGFARAEKDGDEKEDGPPASGLRQPSVAILVPAGNEPREVLKDTFMAINNIDYENKKVYLLDDAKPHHGAKAGMVNDRLKSLSEDYIALFDAGHNPLPDILKMVIPLMEKDESLAFVQTPQFYSNRENNPVARGAAFQQAVFYEYICEGKSQGDAMFSCGTNVVYRTAALKEVGGLEESSIAEDFGTSVKLHTNRWKSLYYPHTHAFGMAPEGLGAYYRQQFRWAAGTISVFRKIVKQLFTDPFSLGFRQWFEYFLSSTYYFIGIVFFIMMLCPLLYLLAAIPSFYANPEVYFFSFFPYIILSMGLFYLILRRRNYETRDIFLGQLLGFSSFSVYIRAAFSALFGMKLASGVTSKIKGKALPYIALWPQVSLILINFIAIVWGLNRFVYELNPAILANSFWAFCHMAVLSAVFYFNGR